MTGRHQDTNKCLSKNAALPCSLNVAHNSSAGVGHFVSVGYPLYDNGDPETGKPLWFEHPSHTADVVALPISDTSEIVVCPYEVTAGTDQLIEPGSLVHVVGFPVDEWIRPPFAVWSTGFVATEPEINHGGRPLFLVDCRSRSGQSGSPVITWTGGHGPLLRKGERQINVGNVHLLGVYSGRIHEDSDLGNVWKSYLLGELLAFAEAA